MKPALTTFTGTLKRLCFDGVANPGRLKIYEWAFPGFFDPLPEESDPSNEHTTIRRRRYSGALFDGLNALPRGRYSSVCINDEGDDRWTLCMELMAYTGSTHQQRFVVADLGDQSAAAALWLPKDHHLLGQPWLLIHCIDPGLTIAQRYASTSDAVLTFYEGEEDAWSTALPYIHEKVSIPNVVDLRLPSTQDWFFETFREGFPGLWLKPEGHLATRFQDMLPTLLGDLLGGNLATESIGLALRLFGASGLVYPSARCDPEVRIEGDSLIDWNGFCLVDYRGAPVQTSEVMGRQFLDVDRWNVPFRWDGLHGYLAELNPNTYEANRTRGSWYLRGICDAHAQFFRSGGHLSSREIGSWPEYSPDEKLASTLVRLRRELNARESS